VSLVNEALKKARLEASRQETLQRGIPVPPPSFFETRRRRAVWPWVALSATGLIALGGLGFWAGQRSARGATPTRASGVQALAADEAAADPNAPRRDAAEPVLRAAAPPTAQAEISPGPAARAASTPTVSHPEPTTHPSAAAPPPQAAASDPVPLPAASHPARTTPRAQPAVPTYVEVADLPGGRLELGGIAWSKSDPHALINGRILGRGERVESYLIVDIQPRQVELSGDRGSFILRLR
jgi:hypothetical protein